jgi:sister chromatid cohesion protein DCC1
MSEYDLAFSPNASNEAGFYKLVELTPDLTTLIENAIKNDEDLRLDFWIHVPLYPDPLASCRLTIKGQSNEDAVLCTADKTFGMRSIGLSNTILVVTPFPDNCSTEFAEDAVVIRDQLNEVIELIPAVAKLQKLSVLIRDRLYDEGNEEEVEEHNGVVCAPFHILITRSLTSFPQQVRFTYDEAKSEIQASDAELDKGLKDRRILIINS